MAILNNRTGRLLIIPTQHSTRVLGYLVGRYCNSRSHVLAYCHGLLEYCTIAIHFHGLVHVDVHVYTCTIPVLRVLEYVPVYVPIQHVFALQHGKVVPRYAFLMVRRTAVWTRALVVLKYIPTIHNASIVKPMDTGIHVLVLEYTCTRVLTYLLSATVQEMHMYFRYGEPQELRSEPWEARDGTATVSTLHHLKGIKKREKLNHPYTFRLVLNLRSVVLFCGHISRLV